MEEWSEASCTTSDADDCSELASAPSHRESRRASQRDMLHEFDILSPQLVGSASEDSNANLFATGADRAQIPDVLKAASKALLAARGKGGGGQLPRRSDRPQRDIKRASGSVPRTGCIAGAPCLSGVTVALRHDVGKLLLTVASIEEQCQGLEALWRECHVESSHNAPPATLLAQHAQLMRDLDHDLQLSESSVQAGRGSNTGAGPSSQHSAAEDKSLWCAAGLDEWFDLDLAHFSSRTESSHLSDTDMLCQLHVQELTAMLSS